MRTLALVILLALNSSCFTSKHFTNYQSRLDGVYFGPGPNVQRNHFIQGKKQFRNYFLFGLLPQDEADIQFAANHLAAHRRSGASHLEITTKKSFLNALAELGINLIPIVGLFQPFVFNFRSTEYTAYANL